MSTKRLSKISYVLLIMACVMLWPQRISAAELPMPTNGAEMKMAYPGLIESVMGYERAWTIGYKDMTNEHLPKDTTVQTGLLPLVKANPEIYEHEYRTAGLGKTVRIGKWVLEWPDAKCIHDQQDYGGNYMGFPVINHPCGRAYNNGWVAYCAECGEPLKYMYMYATRAMVSQIKTMPASSTYLYICPYPDALGGNLEQGTPYNHECRDISYNYYTVKYDKNAPAGTTVTGFMKMTNHMYNNESLYEGRPAGEKGFTDRALRANGYRCEGYEFMGWSTTPGGREVYEDGEEVLNLAYKSGHEVEKRKPTTMDGAKVTLYAVWSKSQSTLQIDANGGTYDGQPTMEVTRYYGDRYLVEDRLVVPPAGYPVTYEENGGSGVEDIVTEKRFVFWDTGEVTEGDFNENWYYFYGSDDHWDRLVAQYTDVSFVLPVTEKEGYVLAGWYKNEQLTEFCGNPGAEYITTKPVTLYAKWVDLGLVTTDDYDSYGGSGAVDAVWTNMGETADYYQLFQSRNGLTWKTGCYDGIDEKSVPSPKFF